MTHSPLPTRVGALVAALALSLVAVQAGAATDPANTCAVAKQKAAGQKLVGKLKCYGIATKKGVAVDSDCLANVEEKFVGAFTKAESGGDCATTGDADDIELLIDSTLEDLLAALPGGPTITTTTTTMPPTCANTYPACEDCRTCANTGNCAGAFSTCAANSACVDLLNCVYTVCYFVPWNQLEVCVESCKTTHAAGLTDAINYLQCTDTECPVCN